MTLLLTAILAVASATPAAKVPACPAQSADPAALAAPVADAVSDFFSATRLRKLHLVRPDLIPYPLAYEVFC